MAIAGKNLFSGTQGPAIASYDGFDFAKGRGIISFFGAAVQSGASTAYVLSQNDVFSDRVLTYTNNTDAALGQNSFGICNDLSFDVKFIRPQIIEGQALINVPHGAKGKTSGKDYDSYIHAYFRIVDEDGNVTTLADSSGAQTNIDETNTEYHMSNIRLEVPRIDLGVTDTLRIQVEQHGKHRNTTSDADWFIAHDPQNRAEYEDDTVSPENTFKLASGASIFKVHIPFIVDV